MKRINKLTLATFMIFVFIVFIPKMDIQANCVHDWEEWYVWSKPTCTQEGYETRECKKCYEVEDRNIPATGIHLWTEWEAEGELCANGTYERHCKECYKTEIMARIGNGNHLYSDWTIISNPDCLNKGKKYRYCYNCYEYFYEDIPSNPKAHAWIGWHINYLKNKRIERNCVICGKIEVKGKSKDSITLSATKKTLKVGKSFTLKVKKAPSGDTIAKYTSNNKKVATVNKKGKVVAKKKGTAKITLKMKSGCKATCTVTVK